MAEILPFARTKKAEVKPTKANVNVPHYFCLKCDTDRFKMYPGGKVDCANCGALMRNIRVFDSDSR